MDFFLLKIELQAQQLHGNQTCSLNNDYSFENELNHHNHNQLTVANCVWLNRTQCLTAQSNKKNIKLQILFMKIFSLIRIIIQLIVLQLECQIKNIYHYRDLTGPCIKENHNEGRIPIHGIAQSHLAISRVMKLPILKSLK